MLKRSPTKGTWCTISAFNKQILSFQPRRLQTTCAKYIPAKTTSWWPDAKLAHSCFEGLGNTIWSWELINQLLYKLTHKKSIK